MRSPLASPANAEVKRLVRLHRSAGRREQHTFLVEGRRIIDGFLENSWHPQQLLIREDLEIPVAWPDDLVRRAGARVIDRVSQASSASGYVAEFAMPQASDPGTIDLSSGGLVLAGLADPGNVGTLIRTAVAFGIRQVAILGGVDPFSYKVVQASAGLLAAVRLFPLQQSSDVDALAAVGPVVALVVDAEDRIEDLPRGPKWMVVGSEAHGIPEDVLGRCSHRVTLPMTEGAESLNAAVAGSIALYLVGPGRSR